MRIVQLGLMEDALDYVYENILEPVWTFVSSLISSGFSYLSEILPKAIEAVMGSILGEVIGRVLDWYYMKWFYIQGSILLLLDCIEDCFNVVSGLKPVYVNNGRGLPLLFAVFNQKTVQTAFYAMLLIGFIICFFMAIVATARNFFELGGEKTKPVTHIIKMTAKSFLYLALAPLIASALILLSQAVLSSIDTALTRGEEKTSIARIIFCIASLDAVDTYIHEDGKEYNVSYTEGPSKASLTDKFRKDFYYEDDHLVLPNYMNPVLVLKTFQIHAFDYFIGIGCGIFFTVIMCMVLAVFIGRIFDIIVLLVIEPFFVGMMPFDDGEYYKKWFELFLGKLFQGFGTVIGMRIYLMILEQLFSGQISFSNSKNLGSRLQDYLMMLVFAMGGAVALKHIGPLITGILSQSAATGEQMSAAAGLKVGEAIANKEAGFVKKTALKPLEKMGGKAGRAFGSLMKKGPAAAGTGDNAGKFDKKSRPAAKSLGGNLTDEHSHASAEQKSLNNMKASVLGGGLDKSTQAKNTNLTQGLKGSRSDEGVSFAKESGSLKKMRENILGVPPLNMNPSGSDKRKKSNSGGAFDNERTSMQDMLQQDFDSGLNDNDALNNGFMQDGPDDPFNDVIGSINDPDSSFDSGRNSGSSFGSGVGNGIGSGDKNGNLTMQNIVGSQTGNNDNLNMDDVLNNAFMQEGPNDPFNDGFTGSINDPDSSFDSGRNSGSSFGSGVGNGIGSGIGSGSGNKSKKTMQDIVGSQNNNDVSFDENDTLNTGFFDDKK